MKKYTYVKTKSLFPKDDPSDTLNAVLTTKPEICQLRSQKTFLSMSKKNENIISKTHFSSECFYGYVERFFDNPIARFSVKAGNDNKLVFRKRFNGHVENICDQPAENFSLVFQKLIKDTFFQSKLFLRMLL